MKFVCGPLGLFYYSVVLKLFHNFIQNLTLPSRGYSQQNYATLLPNLDYLQIRKYCCY